MVDLEIDGGCSRSSDLNLGCFSTQLGPWTGSMSPPSSAFSKLSGAPISMAHAAAGFPGWG